MFSNRRLVVAVVAASVVAACQSAATAGDYIQRKDGSFIPPFKGGTPQTAADFEESKVQVLDADMTNVLYSMVIGDKPQTQKQPSADVTEIILEPKDYPQPTWKEATTAMQSGEWANAAAKFRAIGDDKKVSTVARQQALLRAARATAGPGDAKSIAAADAAYDYLLKEFPASFYTRALWKDRWIMFLDGNDETKAAAAIEQLLKLAGVTDQDKLEARFASTTIRLRKAVGAKDTAGIQKALEEYRALAGETNGKKELLSTNALAKIGMGNCMLELGNATEAMGIFDEMTQREGLENAVNAAAFNGLGECYFRQASPKGFNEALRCFLRTQTIYADGASSDAVAKAMYYTGECFYRLGNNARANQELQTCVNKFGNSTWGGLARKLRQNLPK